MAERDRRLPADVTLPETQGSGPWHRAGVMRPWGIGGPLEAVLASLEDVVYSVDLATGRVLWISPSAREFFGRSPAEFLEDPGLFRRSVLPEDLEAFDAAASRLAGGETVDAEYRVTGSSGEQRSVRDRARPVFGPRGEMLRRDGILSDVTAVRRTEAALRRSEARYRALVEDQTDAISRFRPDGTITFVNAAFCRYFGEPASRILGRRFLEFVPDERAEESHGSRGRAEARGEFPVRETVLARPDGTREWREWRTVALRDVSGEVVELQSVGRDVTDRVRAEEALRRSEERFRHAALHDPLTGLPNRAYFRDQLRRSLERARRRKEASGPAVLYLDLDRFKHVNDGLGHPAGDGLLVGVARRLETSLRPGDTVARLGGDEFAILLEEVRHVSEALRVAERIHEELALPFNVDGHRLHVTASIGIALALDENATPDGLQRDADTALYRAKGRGRARSEIFDEEMHAASVLALELEEDLRRALSGDEFRLLFQPVVSASDGRLAGVEALLRWEHPRRGLLAPADFLPVAEESGLIVPIGRWVLAEALRTARGLVDAGIEGCPVAVNVSGRQLLDSGFGKGLDEALHQAGLPGGSLVLELAEGTAMRGDEPLDAALREAFRLGVPLAIDDFGAGFSWLARLRLLPFSVLKVDGSLVAGIGRDQDRGALVVAALQMARALGLTTTAEGVETETQVEFLRGAGCNRLQGFAVARPMPAADLAAFAAEAAFVADAGLAARALLEAGRAPAAFARGIASP